MAETEILLESGINELEILEFKLGDRSYGINVAKVKEIIGEADIQEIPHAHTSIEGAFRRRGEIFTAINLCRYLDVPEETPREHDLFLITYFNNTSAAFRVDAICTIHHLSWTDIVAPEEITEGANTGIITGIAKIGDEDMIMILDFEKILFDISPATGLQEQEITRGESGVRADMPILIAEDSAFLRKMLMSCLMKAGYEDLISTTNGAEAWHILSSIPETHKDIRKKVACVITDIEMPQMDGMTLTRKIKEDPLLQEIPVVIFSSLIDEANSVKCTEVGADAQLAKPDIARLVGTLDEILQIGAHRAQVG